MRGRFFTGRGELALDRLSLIFSIRDYVKNSPNIGARTITLQNDPRVLPVGKVLRKTKINELPQLFNILRGDMGLWSTPLGPRWRR